MHESHRERMRERYMKQQSFDSFHNHELLEMLLYYSKPRCDTNEPAHRLYERFGTLQGIAEASVEELMEVEGIGEQSAILLKLILELTRRYAEEQTPICERYDTISKISTFFCRRFIGMENENLEMMLLDNGFRMIDCIWVGSGTVNLSEVESRKIHEAVIRKKASIVVFAHNHPHGSASPSEADKRLTDELARTLQIIGVTLMEHLVVNGVQVWPIRKYQMGERQEMVLASFGGKEFMDSFYDINEEVWEAPSFFPKRKSETVKE